MLPALLLWYRAQPLVPWCRFPCFYGRQLRLRSGSGVLVPVCLRCICYPAGRPCLASVLWYRETAPACPASLLWNRAQPGLVYRAVGVRPAGLPALLLWYGIQRPELQSEPGHSSGAPGLPGWSAGTQFDRVSSIRGVFFGSGSPVPVLLPAPVLLPVLLLYGAPLRFLAS